MSAAIVLRPGLARLADWRGIYRGDPVGLDPIARADVEAGAAALHAISARDADGQDRDDHDAGPAVVDLIRKGGGYLPAALVRLFIGLKIGNLGQGVAGVGWPLVQALADSLEKDIVPAVPAGSAGDRLASSHLFAMLTGTGEILSGSRTRSSGKAFKKAGLAPIRLSHDEKRALLTGRELSTAFALAGLFEAERVFQSAVVAGALSAGGHARSGALPHPRLARLARQPGQIEIAAALREMLQPVPGLDAVVNGGGTHSEPASLGRFHARMGACLDLLRQAGETLRHASNGVSGDRLVFWQTEEAVAGIEDAPALAIAADLIAASLAEIARAVEGQLRDAAPADGAAQATRTPRERVAGFLPELAERARPTGFEPDAEHGRDRLSAPGVARLMPMAGTAALVVAIVVLAARSPGGGRPEDGLARFFALLPEAAPNDGGIAPGDLAQAAELVRSGELAAAAGIRLPSVAP